MSGVAARLSSLWRRPEGRRATVPSVLQMEAVECGAASLAMILAHYGRWVPLEELRVLCGVSRDGSKASNIVKAAEHFGLRAKAYKREPQQLRAMRTPLVLHWNLNHFLVLEGIRGDRVYINDPATGPRRVPFSELDAAFTGIALQMEPGPDFEPGGVHRSTMRALAARMKGSVAAFAYVLLAGLLLAIPGLVIPTFLRVFIDNILVQGMSPWLDPLIGAMVLTAIVTGVITWLQQTHLMRFEMKLALTTSASFFWHTLRLPIAFFNQRSAGDLSTRVGINDRIAGLLSGQLAQTGLSIFTVTFYLGLMLRYDVALTALAVVTTALNIAAVKYSAARRVTLNRNLTKDRGQLTGVAMGGLLSIETLKAMGGETAFFARWSGFQTKVLESQQNVRIQTELLAGVPPTLGAVSTVLLLGVGGHRVMSGEMTIGMLVAFQALVAAFTAPANRLVDAGVTVQEIEGSLDRVEDVLASEVDPQTVSTGECGGKLVGRITFSDVTFGYGPLAPPLITGFELDVAPGSRVALVGGSGSGKSTLARLACGLYKPWRGSVRFDDVPRHELSHERLSQSFSMVDQDIFLFEGTVRDNLTLWNPDVPEADLTRAAMDACIHDEIMLQPGGYDSLVEEGGRNFSGGQRQRLEIARALVGNPTILVLDEATSALDPATEKIIDDNLRRRGCACLIIAHRLSTIRDCDEIIVLERGNIAQRGTHDAMVAAPGLYRDLIALEAS